MEENGSVRGTNRQVYCVGKRNVFRLDLKKSRDGCSFFQRGRGRSFITENSGRTSGGEGGGQEPA